MGRYLKVVDEFHTSNTGAVPRWHSDAACQYHDPEIFFPTWGESNKPAKAICAECPVLTECRNFALFHPQPFTLYGIWGGMTRPERQKYRREHDLLTPHERRAIENHRQRNAKWKEAHDNMDRLTDLISDLESRGFQVSRTKKGWRVKGDGQTVVHIHSSSSDRRALQNIYADLRKIGYEA